MLDLTAELRDLIDAFQRLDIEFTLAGPLANALQRSEGIHTSIDLVLWPEDRDVAESGAARPGFQRAGRLRSADAGRYNIQRLIKVNNTDILALNLVVPASLVTATLLGECTTRVWHGRTVRIAGWASVDAERQASRESPRYLALCLLQLFSPDGETWGERDLVPRFEDVEASPEGATLEDIEALLVGLRRRCLWGRRPETVRMVDHLVSAGLAEPSPALGAYLDVVRLAGGWGRIRCYFRNTLAGLQWA